MSFSVWWGLGPEEICVPPTHLSLGLYLQGCLLCLGSKVRCSQRGLVV